MRASSTPAMRTGMITTRAAHADWRLDSCMHRAALLPHTNGRERGGVEGGEEAAGSCSITKEENG
eukprot:832787-Pleurochrysis_carterae.AAC.1